MKRRLVWLGLAAFALGIAVLLYRGPGRVIVRGHLGDVAATMLVYAALGLVWRAHPAARALVTMMIASAIELGQTLWHLTSPAGALFAGSTFDPLDFVAYALGVVVALVWESDVRPWCVRPVRARISRPSVKRPSATVRGMHRVKQDEHGSKEMFHGPGTHDAGVHR